MRKTIEQLKNMKNSLVKNIALAKRMGTSKPKSKSTISKEAYANMKAGFPKRKKLRDGGDVTGEKYYKLERERQNKFKKSEKLNRNIIIQSF
jgi:hypothetical protein